MPKLDDNLLSWNVGKFRQLQRRECIPVINYVSQVIIEQKANLVLIIECPFYDADFIGIGLSERLNADEGNSWDYFYSPGVIRGRDRPGTANETYLVLYNESAGFSPIPDSGRLTGEITEGQKRPNREPGFRRKPYYMQFNITNSNSSFDLIACHLTQQGAGSEVEWLSQLSVLNQGSATCVATLIAGDFNSNYYLTRDRCYSGLLEFQNSSNVIEHYYRQANNGTLLGTLSAVRNINTSNPRDYLKCIRYQHSSTYVAVDNIFTIGNYTPKFSKIVDLIGNYINDTELTSNNYLENITHLQENTGDNYANAIRQNSVLCRQGWAFLRGGVSDHLPVIASIQI